MADAGIADQICCLCWLDGIRRQPVKGWTGFPICREHVSEILGNNTDAAPVRPSPGLEFATPSLQ